MVVIRRGRHPHEVALLVAAGLLGLAGLVAFEKVGTYTIRNLPEPFGMVFYAGLLAGAVVSLAGCFLSGLAGPLVERAGLLGLGLLFAGYAVTVLGLFGLRGLSFGLFLVAFALANAVRCGQIQRELTEMQAVRVLMRGKP